jgi:hypothetical protein
LFPGSWFLVYLGRQHAKYDHGLSRHHGSGEERHGVDIHGGQVVGLSGIEKSWFDKVVSGTELIPNLRYN